MSLIGSIVTDILADLVVAIPTLTTLDGYIRPEDIHTDDLPHAQAFNVAVEVTEELDFWQEKQNVGFTVLLTTRGETQEALITKYELILTRFRANPRLGATVDRVTVPSMAIEEVAATDPTGAGLQFIVFELVARRIVGA